MGDEREQPPKRHNGVRDVIAEQIDYIDKHLRPRSDEWREVTNKLREAYRIADVIEGRE